MKIDLKYALEYSQVYRNTQLHLQNKDPHKMCIQMYPVT